jgi:hypothetical protein
MVAEEYKKTPRSEVPGISSRVSETLESAPGPECENKFKKTPRSYKTGQIKVPSGQIGSA